jgi:hypothetical protein
VSLYRSILESQTFRFANQVTQVTDSRKKMAHIEEGSLVIFEAAHRDLHQTPVLKRCQHQMETHD